MKKHLMENYWLYATILILLLLLMHSYSLHEQEYARQEATVQALAKISDWIESNNFETQCEK